MVSFTVALILTVRASCYIFYLIKYITVLNLETRRKLWFIVFFDLFFLPFAGNLWWVRVSPNILSCVVYCCSHFICHHLKR